MVTETRRGLQHLLYILDQVGHAKIRMSKTMQGPLSGRANEEPLMSSKQASHHTQSQEEVESFSYLGSVVEENAKVAVVIEVKRKKLSIVFKM